MQLLEGLQGRRHKMINIPDPTLFMDVGGGGGVDDDDDNGGGVNDDDDGGGVNDDDGGVNDDHDDDDGGVPKWGAVKILAITN